jgi:hypothetical protein
MIQSKNTHLSRADIIKNGSVFTRPELVDLVKSMVNDFISPSTIIGDFGSGYGAFIEKFKNCGLRCFGTELDDLSYNLLISEYPNINIYHENSLINISRDKYLLNENDDFIVVGNPPYNDTTSIFKKGEKGTLICDEDVVSRDFGVSFLKAYDKLHANYVCILHPLAYLIKKQNFNSLGRFKEHYKLLNATIFSSKEFESIKKSNSDFPVVAALYKKDDIGMTYEYIKQFEFNIFHSEKKFMLSKIETIDGIVEKYPKKNNKIGLQFYTLRDMNALLRNAGFVENRPSNGLEVNDDNLHQYCWLSFLKMNFKPSTNTFIFGNLSPLYTKKLEDPIFKNKIIAYAYNNIELIRKYYSMEKLEGLYGSLKTDYDELFLELKRLESLFE